MRVGSEANGLSAEKLVDTEQALPVTTSRMEPFHHMTSASTQSTEASGRARIRTSLHRLCVKRLLKISDRDTAQAALINGMKQAHHMISQLFAHLNCRLNQ